MLKLGQVELQLRGKYAELSELSQKMNESESCQRQLLTRPPLKAQQHPDIALSPLLHRELRGNTYCLGLSAANMYL